MLGDGWAWNVHVMKLYQWTARFPNVATSKARQTYIFFCKLSRFPLLECLLFISLVGCRVSKIVVLAIFSCLVFVCFWFHFIPYLSVDIFKGVALLFPSLWHEATFSPFPLHYLLLFAPTTVCRKWRDFYHILSFTLYIRQYFVHIN